MISGNVRSADKDTISIYFKVNCHTIDTLFNANKAQLVRLDNLLDHATIDSIQIIASTLPDGKLPFNAQLARRRKDALLNYIKARLITDSTTNITSSLCNITWDNVLHKVKQDPLFPHRLTVIKILEDNTTNTFQKQQRLKQMGKGIACQKIANRWLPQERFAQCIIHLQKSDSSAIVVMVQEESIDSLLPTAMTETLPLSEEKPAQWRFTTNLAYWVALAHNAGVEYAFNDQQTLSLSGACAWWSKLARQRVYRWMVGELAYHHYFRHNYRHSGFFAGTYLQTGEFELMFGRKNRKGEFTAAGLCGGYRWRVGDHFSLHTELGIGYMYVDYRYAFDIDKTLIRQGRNYTHYIGPTRLSFSLVYHLKSKK